ncbi:MAG: LexA family transcriptional regulator [Brevinema sp.]
MGIKKIRKEMRMTQKEFAEMLGLTQGYLSELETGKSPITQNIINMLRDHNLDLILDADHKQMSIPIVDIQAAAGTGVTNASELVSGSLPLSDKFSAYFGDNVAIISVSGDSMEPTISHQDWLLVRRQEEILSEGIFVFLQDNELRVKRIQKELSGRVLVISDNEKYHTEVYTNEDLELLETKVIGRVVGIIQKT